LSRSCDQRQCPNLLSLSFAPPFQVAALAFSSALDVPSALAGVVFRRVSWLLFGARQHPSFLDSDPIRLIALAPLFTLSLVGMARRFSSFTVPHNRTLCGAKLPLLSPSGSLLLPLICEDMDCLQSRLEG
jgi:hypothetical protein